MSKRFTDSRKFRDSWYLSLSPAQKCAWEWLLAECDHAGYVEIVEVIANAQIGTKLDWSTFLEKCAHRVVALGEGKFWVKAFIDFQYGTLNPENRVHASVIKRQSEMSSMMVLASPLLGAKDKDKEKDKDQEKVKEKDQEGWVVPELLDTPEIRVLLGEFAAMRRSIGKPIKSLRNTSRVLVDFESVEHLTYALNQCIAHEWQGLKPEYRPTIKTKKPSSGGEQTYSMVIE